GVGGFAKARFLAIEGGDAVDGVVVDRAGQAPREHRAIAGEIATPLVFAGRRLRGDPFEIDRQVRKCGFERAETGCSGAGCGSAGLRRLRGTERAWIVDSVRAERSRISSVSLRTMSRTRRAS